MSKFKNWSVLLGWSGLICGLSACSSAPPPVPPKPPKIVPTSGIASCVMYRDYLSMRRCEVEYNNRYFRTDAGFSTVEPILQPFRPNL